MTHTGRPTPLFNDVLIKNPLAGDAGKEIQKQAEKLPEKERNEFLETQLRTMWGEVEIIAAGSDCRALAQGDKAIATPEAVTSAMQTPDGQYLFIPERAFRGKW